MRVIHILGVLFLGLATVACGGDGTKLIALNTTNGVEVASDCSGVMPFMVELSDLAETYLDALEGGQVPACDVGTVDVVKDDRVPVGEISVGDRITVTFQGCLIEFQGGMVRFDGSMVLVVQEVVDNPPAWSARFSASLNSLSLYFDPDTVTLSGNFAVDVSTPDDIVYTTVATGTLSAVSQEGNQTNTTTISGFRYHTIYNWNNDQWSTRLDATVEDGNLGGAVQMETVTAFSGVGENPPSVGEVLLRGSGGSLVRLVAVDDENVRILIDEDGDGTPEQTVNLTWGDL